MDTQQPQNTHKTITALTMTTTTTTNTSIVTAHTHNKRNNNKHCHMIITHIHPHILLLFGDSGGEGLCEQQLDKVWSTHVGKTVAACCCTSKINGVNTRSQRSPHIRVHGQSISSDWFDHGVRRKVGGWSASDGESGFLFGSQSWHLLRFSLHCVGAEIPKWLSVAPTWSVLWLSIPCHPTTEFRWFPLLFTLCSITLTVFRTQITRLDSTTISFSDHLIHDLMSPSSSYLWTNVLFLRENCAFHCIEHGIFGHVQFNGIRRSKMSNPVKQKFRQYDWFFKHFFKTGNIYFSLPMD